MAACWSSSVSVARALLSTLVAGQRLVILPDPHISMAQHRYCLECPGQWDVLCLQPLEGKQGAVITACMHFEIVSKFTSETRSAATLDGI